MGYEIKIKQNLTNIEWFNTFKARLWRDYKATTDYTFKHVLMGYIKELEERVAFNTQDVKAPTLAEIKKYVIDEKLFIDAQEFFDYYNQRDWRIANEKICDWHAVADKWNRKLKKEQNQNLTPEQIEKKVKDTLERRRNKAEAQASKNLDYALSDKDYAKNQNDIMQLTFDIASGGASKENMKKLKDLQDASVLLLKKLQLLPEDLKPHYHCSKCNDTGFVGFERCDCFNELIDKYSK